MSGASKKLMGTTAAGGAEFLAVEDVFQSWLYTGNGTSQTITNGIDLDGEGGLVWIKGRNIARDHLLFDTERGAGKYIRTDSTNAEVTDISRLSAFNSDGFSLGSNITVNNSSETYASWTFRKAPRFFDVVTYTGDGVAGRTISHDLGVEPGCIIVKKTDTTRSWMVYHRGIDATSPEDYHLALNFNFSINDLGQSPASPSNMWNQTAPTDTQFSVGVDSNVNDSGGTYVAYLFAHDPLGPSEDGSDGLIACGSYAGNSSTDGPAITLGWEPQWVMVKSATGVSSPWLMYDTMRGMVSGGLDAKLQANTSDAENQTSNFVTPTATGFKIESSDNEINNDNSTYIYIAIRRGPMRAPTSGTEVFAPVADTGDKFITSGFPVDMVLAQPRSSGGNTTFDRMRGATSNLRTYSTAAEASASGGFETWFDYQNGIDYNWYGSGTNLAYHMFRRAPGFFDVVAYTGDGVVGSTTAHNLKVIPEMIITRRRNDVGDWYTVLPAALGADKFLTVNDASATITFTLFSSISDTQFTHTGNATNTSGGTYIAYLFATLPGVSKVGSYTGSFPTSTTQTIDCGFTTSARFVLIKAASRSGAWAVWDSARGITVSDDPRLELNNTNAEQTQSNIDVEPHSSGFIIDSSSGEFNEEGETYIFYAIA
jgi:hypothetical protein